ncbi:hypothetical protein A2Z00_03425 [Candidatus Gottesmanbacteria bacterium RBG_13_45_10]|uniref:Uncharacterized protein n=1 Tax=Candidatus Gottesmanbacteria bacterium RBG_13_45_10 TaxID=1798370 RepID=A0A1F5ZG98_9BACT|nr:MAG: hypothetical protein A2Z00_03425 [Candidatus Gottesmanbacteria bacterium RBG_13_45_10]
MLPETQESSLPSDIVYYPTYDALIDAITPYARPQVITAMRRVPRNLFASDEFQALALTD